MRSLANYFAALVMIVAIGLVGLLTFWLTYPYKTVVFHNSPMPVVSPVARGEQLLIYTEFTRYTDLPATCIARYTDGITFTTVPTKFQKAPGTYKGTSCTWKVPEVLPPGRYYLDVSFSYEVNPVRTVVVQTRTQEFEVR